MSLQPSFPLKLTEEEHEQLKELKRRTGYSRSKILRMCVVKFLREFGGSPDEVQQMYSNLSSKGLLDVSSSKASNSEVLGLVKHAEEEADAKPKRKKKRKPGHATPGQ